MERYEFCQGAKCAKLTITVDGESPLIFLSRSPSLFLEVDIPEVEFTHEMNAPIDGQEFPFLIGRVENTGGFWYYNSPPADFPKLDCPMPGTYPVPDNGGGPTREEVTDLYWHKYWLYCYFDTIDPAGWKDYYLNNVGSCTYKVFGVASYNFFDKQGTLYKNSFEQKIDYKIECNACCKDNEILCDSHYFPGYTCYPIPPVSRKLLNGINDIRRYWR